MFTITFKRKGSSDVKVTASPGDNILELAMQAGVAIDAPCSGNGTCGKCFVKVISGAVESEKSVKISEEDYEDGWRLSCQSKVMCDATLFVPASAESFKSDIQTADLSSQEELARYFELVTGIFNTGIQKGDVGVGNGIAVDIGTTTVTAALLRLKSGFIKAKASLGNGQIIYGADVINRIIQQGKPGGVDKLRRAVREETVIPLIETLCKDAGIEPTDVSRMVIAGNTTMEHLFVGANGDSIRLEPYEPEFLELRGKTAADLGLPVAPDAPVVFAPNVGSYVGGDITAGVLTTLMWNNPEMTLFIDLGTNGEMVLGNSDFMLTCACSAGPAFEGGDISCGMRATHGAIESCSIDAETMEPTMGIIGEGAKPIGLCGSGIIDVISELFRCGIINAKGKFVRDGERILRDEYGAAYVLAFAKDSGIGKDVTINEIDIDNFIRAKAAIFSAIRAMLNAVDMTPEDIDYIMIAGGIGSGIDIAKSISIGMLPKLPLDKYIYIGNSSLTGACAMLISNDATEKVHEISANMTYLELSTHPGYMDEFVAACFLPHTDASLFD